MERALLVGVDTGEDKDFGRSMEELGSLAEACNIETVGTVTQKMDMINKAFYIGTGKVAEVKEAAFNMEAELIIFDNALSPSQLRNLQKELEKPILDRTTLILDIFSKRAKTREAKLQVETARLQYLLPRLVGMHEALTRQGGASGSMSSKGAGEKKLELDRRRIEQRLAELRKELEEVSKERETQRKKRMSSRIPKAALVGYTNAGKSTLLNAMVERYVQEEDKKVLEKDMLFATLETTVRNIQTGNNKDFFLSDTVGFIHKLPHGLIKAFRSTLEEVKNADLLIHVVDFSDESYKQQIEVTEETLQELGAGEIPVVTVYNKADLTMTELPKVIGTDSIYMSAKSRQGLDELVAIIQNKLYADYGEAAFLIPYDKGQIAAHLSDWAVIKEREYREDGIFFRVECSSADTKKYEKYRIAT